MYGIAALNCYLNEMCEDDACKIACKHHRTLEKMPSLEILCEFVTRGQVM